MYNLLQIAQFSFAQFLLNDYILQKKYLEFLSRLLKFSPRDFQKRVKCYVINLYNNKKIKGGGAI